MQTLTDEQVQSVKNYAAAMRREIIKMITEAQSDIPVVLYPLRM